MLSRQRQKEIASLSHKKYRQRLGQTLVEGVRALSSALAAGAPLVEVVVTHEAARLPEVQIIRRGLGVPVHEVDAPVMGRISEVETSQGVLAVASLCWRSLSAMLEQDRVLVLDGVQDPGNLGTLIRTASWFGIRGVLLGPGAADPFAPKAIRASMGSIWEVGIAEAADLPAALDRLRDAGMQLYVADLEGVTADAWRPGPRSALILGNEAHGVSAEARSRADAGVTVPGAAGRRATESLNVATAGAVLMYQWTR